MNAFDGVFDGASIAWNGDGTRAILAIPAVPRPSPASSRPALDSVWPRDVLRFWSWSESEAVVRDLPCQKGFERAYVAYARAPNAEALRTASFDLLDDPLEERLAQSFGTRESWRIVRISGGSSLLFSASAPRAFSEATAQPPFLFLDRGEHSAVPGLQGIRGVSFLLVSTRDPASEVHLVDLADRVHLWNTRTATGVTFWPR